VLCRCVDALAERPLQISVSRFLGGDLVEALQPRRRRRRFDEAIDHERCDES
jgi:hypothetical protein